MRAVETGRKASIRRASFFSLFHSECKLILYLATMYVSCVYPAISKSLKQLPNCLKIAETNFDLIVFNGVICDVSTYTVTIPFCCSTWIRYQKCFITLKFIWLPLLVLKITQLQDKFNNWYLFFIWGFKKMLGTDHLTCRGRGYGFLFRFEFFFRTTRVRIFFFVVNLTLGYMTKTLNQIFFFPPPKSEYFFQQHWESE